MTSSQSKQYYADLFAPLQEQMISIIVPVFNESEQIRPNLDLLISEIEPYFRSYEILVISDGSTDGTNQELSQYGHPQVKCIFLPKNQGKGAAIREGFRSIQGDYVLFIDGGMELHPKEIRIFLGLLMLYQADIVIGSKRHPQSKVDYPAFRKFLSAIYQQLIKFLFRLDVTDTQVGMKLFRRAVIDAIREDLRIDRYGFDLELLALAKKRGFDQMLEAPIRLDYFSHNSRPWFSEVLHVLRVGLTILVDTLSLARRLANLRRQRKKEQIQAQNDAEHYS